MVAASLTEADYCNFMVIPIHKKAYMNMCAYMSIYIYIYIHREREMCIYIYIYICTHTCTYIYIYTHTCNVNILISLSLYIYIYMYTCIRICMCVYIYREREREMYPSPGRPGLAGFRTGLGTNRVFTERPQIPYIFQDSSKGGAVETGCSDLYDVIH